MSTMNDLLRHLPGRLSLKIRRILDTEECWKSFILGLDGDFTMPQNVVDKLQFHPQPAHELLLWLISQEMTIGQFVNYVQLAKIHSILELFDIRVPISIVQQPFPEWNVTVGDSLSLELKVVGSPQPVFQWYKDNLPIPNATRSALHIAVCQVAHCGVYKCELRTSQPQDPSIFSNPVQVYVLPAKPVVISVQPRSFTAKLHGSALLRCEVQGDVNVDYQWMRDGKELSDIDDICKGSNTNELRIYNIESTIWRGYYCCRISRGEEVYFTQDAVLQVDTSGGIFSLKPKGEYQVTDKVALLMGAGDYRGEPSLKAPRHDVQTMATAFRALNFKVVALLDLTKKEMIAAIHEFKLLVGEGVYCVFYFAGHGFESAGQCFLLPPDAPLGRANDHCLSADAILFNILLPQRPAMCCMILDMCRIRHDGITVPPRNRKPDGEYFVCYGTCQGSAAYEKKDGGILVSHLKDILLKRIGVEEVFSQLREDIKEDPVFLKEEQNGEKKKQTPEIRTVLTRSDRSFHDEIDPKGFTTEFNHRQAVWENAHRLPGSREIIVNFPGFDVTLKLDFVAELSNLLTITTTVIDRGLAKICNAHISEIPGDVAQNSKAFMTEAGTETTSCINRIALHGVQRLKTTMLIKWTVSCILQDNSKVERVIEEDLGCPLVSSLRLWEEYPDLSHDCEPEEDLDEIQAEYV